MACGRRATDAIGRSANYNSRKESEEKGSKEWD